MSCEIVSYEPRFREGVIELQRRFWSSDAAANSAYFAWKYEQNPNFKEPLLYLALDRQRVVGTRGLYGTKWRSESSQTELVLPAIADSFVLPEFREEGTYQKLTKRLIEDLSSQGFPYVLNFSPSGVNLVNSLMMGWRKVGSFRPLVLRSAREMARHRRLMRRKKLKRQLRQLIPNGLIPSWADGTKLRAHRRRPRDDLGTTSKLVHGRAGENFDGLDQACNAAPLGKGLPVVIEKAARPEAMARLVRGAGAGPGITHVRDEAFFAWRFANPFAQYRFVFCGEVDLQGYLVVGHSATYRSDEVIILDWQGASVEIMAELLSVVIEAGKFDHLVVWSASLEAKQTRILTQMGFLPDEMPVERLAQANVPIIRSLENPKDPAQWYIDGHHVLDQSNWDLRALYSDAY